MCCFMFEFSLGGAGVEGGYGEKVGSCYETAKLQEKVCWRERRFMVRAPYCQVAQFTSEGRAALTVHVAVKCRFLDSPLKDSGQSRSLHIWVLVGLVGLSFPTCACALLWSHIGFYCVFGFDFSWFWRIFLLYSSREKRLEVTGVGSSLYLGSRFRSIYGSLEVTQELVEKPATRPGH